MPGRKRQPAAVLASTLGLCLAIGVAASQASTVAVYDDPAKVDTANGSGSESDNVQASLAAAGHSVTTFTALTPEALAATLAGKDVLFIPELENGDLTSAMTIDSRRVVRQFIGSGGTLALNGHDVGTRAGSFINSTFGFSVAETEPTSNPYALQADAVGTEYEGGPSSLTVDNGSQGLTDTSLPPGARIIYHDTGADAVVAMIPYGLGSINYLGWDWFNSNPPNAAGQDGGWQNVLNRAVAVPAASVNDVTVSEGTSGTVTARFTISLPGVRTETATVGYSTADGSATAPSDYAATSGSVTFAPGETSKTVDVAVAADSVDEQNESFALNLSDGTAYSVGDGTGTATITDDDNPTVAPVTPDTTAPTVALSKIPASTTYAKFLKGVKFSVTPSEASAFETQLLGSAKGAVTVARTYNVILARKNLARAAGKRTITLKASRKLVRKPRKSFTARIVIVAIDAAGNRKTTTKSIKVKRR